MKFGYIMGGRIDWIPKHIIDVYERGIQMNKKQISLLVLTLVLGAGFIFFMNTTSNEYVPKDYRWFPKVKSESEILLYDSYMSRIISYDTKSKKPVEYNDTGNFVQYGFKTNTKTNLYTAGHSALSDFSIVELKDNIVDELYVMPKNEGIFPIAIYDDIIVFQHCFYKKDGAEIEEKRTLSIFNKSAGTLTDFLNTSGLISAGAFYQEKLYYTVYNDEQNNYDLYEIDYKNIESIPILVKSGLEFGEIITHGDKLFISDKKYIYTGDKKLNNGIANFVDKDTNNLIQLILQNGGYLSLAITDLDTYERYINVDNAIDFKIDGNTVTVYCEGEIKTVTLR